MTNPPPKDEARLEFNYSLVIAVSKRARQIVNNRERLNPGRKPVTTALEEILQGKVKIVRNDEGAEAEDPQ